MTKWAMAAGIVSCFMCVMVGIVWLMDTYPRVFIAMCFIGIFLVAVSVVKETLE